MKNGKKKIFFIYAIRLSNNITERHKEFQVQIWIFRVSVSKGLADWNEWVCVFFCMVNALFRNF